jgi:hypothetical protein
MVRVPSRDKRNGEFMGIQKRTLIGLVPVFVAITWQNSASPGVRSRKTTASGETRRLGIDILRTLSWNDTATAGRSELRSGDSALWKGATLLTSSQSTPRKTTLKK